MPKKLGHGECVYRQGKQIQRLVLVSPRSMRSFIEPLASCKYNGSDEKYSFLLGSLFSMMCLKCLLIGCNVLQFP